MEIHVEDDIETRFPELVADFNQDSDELFDSLLASNNINFTRSRTCIMDDFQFSQSTPQRKRTNSMNSINLTPSRPNSKSKTSLQKGLQKSWSVKVHAKDKNSSLHSKTPLKSISSNTLDCFTPGTIEKRQTTGDFISTPRPSLEKSLFDENNHCSSLSRVTLLKTPTHTPSRSSVKNDKITVNLTENRGKLGSTDIRQECCIQQKHKESLSISGLSPFHNITFRNKTSQKKDQRIVSNCDTNFLDCSDLENENNSLASKFNIVSSCNYSPLLASLMTESPSTRYNLLKTPNTSNYKDLGRLKGSRPNKTPTMDLSCQKPQGSKSLTGVKKLQASIASSKRKSLQLNEKKVDSNRIGLGLSVNKDMSLVDDDDMPCTQPISEIILRGKLPTFYLTLKPCLSNRY